MSLPRYPDYKDSGVPWLGEVPGHWEVTRYKNVFKERDERSIDGAETLLSVSAYTGISPRSEIIDNGEHLSRADSLEGYKVCWPNDLVMNIMLAWNRGLGVTQYHGIVSPAYSVFKITNNAEPKFLDYMMRSDQVTLYYKAFSSGVIDSRLRLYPDTFGSLFCALPPAKEQTTIAHFLDRETAKIDALIAEQEKLLALLAEKRQATISHAVTRGLNPNVAMKDSGIAWLGNIPNHWKIVKISRHFQAKKGSDGSSLTKEYCATIEGNHPVYSGQTENNGIMAYINEFEFDAGESGYLFSTTVGAKAMTIMHLKGKFSLSQNCMVIIPRNTEIITRYFFYQLQPLFAHERTLIPSHMQASFRMEDLHQYKIPLPPNEEQRDISEFLDIETRKLDTLQAEAQHIIELLKERRNALISAAVTGKIDVRNAA